MADTFVLEALKWKLSKLNETLLTFEQYHDLSWYVGKSTVCLEMVYHVYNGGCVCVYMHRKDLMAKLNVLATQYMGLEQDLNKSLQNVIIEPHHLDASVADPTLSEKER